MKKSRLILVGCFIFLFVFFLSPFFSDNATAMYGHSSLWVRVVRYPYVVPNANVYVVKEGVYYRMTYQLSPYGWGYYNNSLEPGTYRIIVNGWTRASWTVYAPPFTGISIYCYI